MAKEDIFNLFWQNMMFPRKFVNVNNVRQSNNVGNVHEKSCNDITEDVEQWTHSSIR
jgi:hypothetical protein